MFCGLCTSAHNCSDMCAGLCTSDNNGSGLHAGLCTSDYNGSGMCVGLCTSDANCSDLCAGLCTLWNDYDLQDVFNDLYNNICFWKFTEKEDKPINHYYWMKMGWNLPPCRSV